MGFGTLFIGYFLVLNFAYHGYTDAICGILTLYGAYKLSSVNKNFKAGTIFTLIFTVFGIFELGFAVYDMLVYGESPALLYSIISIVRYLLIALLSLFLLFGMRDVANEVKLRTLGIKCERVSYMTFPIYALSIVLEILGIFGIFGAQVLTILGVITLVCNLALIIMTLICIYSCYMRICMPGETMDTQEKKSRFGFVNALRRHEEEKQREYAEYRLEKYKRTQEKKKGKKKK